MKITVLNASVEVGDDGETTVLCTNLEAKGGLTTAVAFASFLGLVKSPTQESTPPPQIAATVTPKVKRKRGDS